MKPVNHVAVLNHSDLDDIEIAIIVEAYRAALPDFCAAWMLPVPGLAVYGRGHSQALLEEGELVFTDTQINPDAFGAHTVPRWGYIDVGTCRAYGEPVSRCFGHELFELLADPELDRWAGPMPNGDHYAIEVADPVQRYSSTMTANLFGRQRDVEIADYVLPAWFDPTNTGPVDAMRVLKNPLQIAPGGYIVREHNGVTVTHGDLNVRVSSFGRTFRRMSHGRTT